MWAFLVLLACVATASFAQAPGTSQEEFQQLEAESRAIKSEMLDLEAELSSLEQDILYPAPSRWTVFVTSEDASPELQQITLELAGQTIASHEYSADEQAALREGGAHRLYIGNLNTGQHQINVRYNGQGEDDTVAPAHTFVINKNSGPQLMELHWQPKASGSARLTHTSTADIP